MDDRSDMLAAQRESVHHLHALKVTRGRHDVKQRAVDRQRAAALRQLRPRRLGEQFGLFAVGTLGVGQTMVRPAAPAEMQYSASSRPSIAAFRSATQAPSWVSTPAFRLSPAAIE